MDGLRRFRMSTLAAVTIVAAIAAGSVRSQDGSPDSKANGGKIISKPLVIKEGGTAEKPAVFDGQGMVVDLGIDVSGQDWEKVGDLWRSNGKLMQREPIAAGEFPGLFLEEIPVAVPRDREAEKKKPDSRGRCYVSAEKLAPGQMGYADDGSVYFRWPTGKQPGSCRVVLPPKPGISCVTIACSHIIVRNITAKHASNDGFNIHGKWIGIRVENVRALSNCDEGISAHDDVEMEVVDSEIAWNGSVAGGVADVNRCTTSYRNCQLHDNVGPAFKFTGKSHRVSDILIYNQVLDFSVGPETKLVRDRIEWRKTP